MKALDLTARTVISKTLDDVTRRIDLDIENIFIEELKKSNIPAVLLTEERGFVTICENPNYLIILDPLDGSANFTLNIPFYAISVAVCEFREDVLLHDVKLGIGEIVG